MTNQAKTKYLTETETDGTIFRYTATIRAGWVTVTAEFFQDASAAVSSDVDLSEDLARCVAEEMGLKVVGDSWFRISWREMSHQYSGLGTWCAKLTTQKICST